MLEGRPSYYAHSSVYACPTTKASFGITLLESMACETPVVCSDILGFRDVVVDEREALMVPCGDRDALADALVRVLDDRGTRDSTRHHRAAEFARILVGACHVARARRVSERSRKRRRREYDRSGSAPAPPLLGGAVHGAFHRNSPLFGRPITRLATDAIAPSRSPSTTARIPTRRRAILDALARARRAERRSSFSAATPSGGRSSCSASPTKATRSATTATTTASCTSSRPRYVRDDLDARHRGDRARVGRSHRGSFARRTASAARG